MRVTGTSQKYSDSFISSSAVKPYRYVDLFELYLDGRLDEDSYLTLATSLTQAWGSHLGNNKVVSANILRQEEVVTADRSSAWKLSYRLDLTQGNPAFTARNTKPPAASLTQRQVVLTNAQGHRYNVVDVTDPVQISQTYGVVLSHRVFKEDSVKFANALKEVVANSLQGQFNKDDVSITVAKEEQVVSSTSKLGWSVTFIAKHMKTLVDASLQPSLTTTSIQNQLTFTSPNNLQYSVLDTAASGQLPGYRKYSDAFSLDLQGLVPSFVMDRVAAVLKTSWEDSKTFKNIQISRVGREEYIGMDGLSVTKVFYFVDESSKPLYPSLTLSPDTAKVIAGLPDNRYKATAYTGTQLYRASSSYRLVIYRAPAQDDKIDEVLEKAWNTSQNSQGNIKLQVLKRGKYIGRFGTELTGFWYKVSIDGRTVEPDYVMGPSTSTVTEAARGTSIRLYSSSTQYRAAALHSVRVAGEVSKNKTTDLETSLTFFWGTKYTGQTTTASVVGYQETVDMATGTLVPELFYNVRVGNSDLPTWRTGTVSEDDVATALNQGSPSQYEIWVNATEILSKFFIRGTSRSVYAKKDQISNSLRNAWASANNVSASSVSLTLAQADELASTNFVDNQWAPVTVFKYGVKIGTSDKISRRQPSAAQLSTAISQSGVTPVTGVVHRLRKLYIRGSPATQDYIKVQTSLSSAWIKSNTGLSSINLKVTVKTPNSRTQRDVYHSEKFTFVGKKNEEVSPVDFTVSVEGEEPNPAVVSPPSDPVLDSSLSTAAISTCGCRPGVKGSLTLLGKTNTTQQSKVQGAVEKAVLKQNTDIRSGDIETKIYQVKDDTADGSTVSIVTYRVDCSSSTCDIESLTPPTKAVLEKELGTVGEKLYSKAVPVKEEDEENKWLIPVAIACGVVVFIIIVMVICCIIYRRRHRKMGDLKKQEEDVHHNNAYDKEHFSDAAVFDTPPGEGDILYKDQL